MTNSESGARSPQSQKPLWKNLAKWFLALLGPVIVGVSVAWITGTFEGRPPHPPKLTEERYVRPFSREGLLQKPYRITQTFQNGECTNHSQYSTDPEALGCGSGGQILDPCWQAINPETAVTLTVCLRDPWDPRVKAIKNSNTWDELGPGKGDPQPWALEIRDPSNSKSTLQCAWVGGLGDGGIAGMRENWRCSPPGEDVPTSGAIGKITRSHTEPWTVLYARENSPEVLRAEIITIWH
ncbi:hypothetical protein ACIGBH_42100 [Streptomyces sp. NPDC085929]|uniref:hypothetical protein n=1 Tax=Streptomyces sp. NPDC085929 TaxID=3365739 RepID=UPI0037D0F587